LNTTLTPHSIIPGDACFAYFNKNWGIPMCVLRRSTPMPMLRLEAMARVAAQEAPQYSSGTVRERKLESPRFYCIPGAGDDEIFAGKLMLLSLY
jgi:hypothetical protein